MTCIHLDGDEPWAIFNHCYLIPWHQIRDDFRCLQVAPVTGITSPIWTCHTFYLFSFWLKVSPKDFFPLQGLGTFGYFDHTTLECIKFCKTNFRPICQNIIPQQLIISTDTMFCFLQCGRPGTKSWTCEPPKSITFLLCFLTYQHWCQSGPFRTIPSNPTKFFFHSWQNSKYFTETNIFPWIV